MQQLKTLLEPVSRFVISLDLEDAAGAEAALNEAFPPESEGVTALVEAAGAELSAGGICHRGEEGMRYSRVLKPEQDVAGCSVDAVLMKDSKGPFHTHDRGEVCLCIPREGTPTFEGRQATWMVLPPGSRHQPTVQGGEMLILYWWPEGAVTWG